MAKVLVVDDEVNVRNVFKRSLEKHQHEVYLAEDGQQCEELYIKYKPDVIILDILMPNQEGIETILNLKVIDKTVKIIAISGGGMGSADYYLDNALKLGATFAMEKPVVLSDLNNKVEKLLSM